MQSLCHFLGPVYRKFSATQIQLRHHPTNRNLLTFRMREGAAEVASAHQRALIYYYVMLVNT